MNQVKKNRRDQLVEQSQHAFENHVITRRSEGRWLLQRQYEDGKPDWTMAAEVISLAGGALYVGGDIDFVIFSWFSDSTAHEDKVRWMGKCNDLEYYVHQKACIGTGRELIDVYDAEVAEETLKEWLKDEQESNGRNYDRLKELIDDGLRYDDGRHELINRLYDELGHGFAFDRGDVGIVMAPRVYCAHAALRRLCDLLDAERSAQPAHSERTTSPPSSSEPPLSNPGEAP